MSEPNDIVSHDVRIRQWLVMLRHEAHSLEGIQVIGRGLSGAYVYAVRLAGAEYILKITDATNEGYVLERAKRELEFYRHLAHLIPLQVPEVVASHADAAGIGLLLRAHEPSCALQLWDEGTWCAIAQQLARFHATFWGTTDELVRFHWLRKEVCNVSQDRVEQAIGHWKRLSELPQFEEILTPGELQWISSFLSRTPAIERIIQLLPPTLCHGDCHSSNLLRGSQGEWLWADWQEVGLGRGPGDLSFLFQHAAFEGSTIPQDAVTATYQRALERETSTYVSIDVIRSCLDAIELRTELLDWPMYLSNASTRQLEDMVQSMHDLAHRLNPALS